MKKIVLPLLSVFLLVTLLISTLNPSSVMALVGLSALDAKTLEKSQGEAAKSLNAGLNDLAKRLGKNSNMVHSSDDGAVVIVVTKGKKDVTVNIAVDASVLPDMNYKDVGKVIKTAQKYMKPVLTEKQTTGLCGLLLTEAYAQYKKGKTKISMTKQFDEVTIKCSGDVSSGSLNVDLIGKLGVNQCPPSKSKTMEMKALPL